jgi:hypothetical protein
VTSGRGRRRGRPSDLVLVYVGFKAALSRWPSTRVYAWTFLVPVVPVLVESVRGSLPGTGAMVGIVLVILGVAIVNLPRAEGAPVDDTAPAENETSIQPAARVPSERPGRALVVMPATSRSSRHDGDEPVPRWSGPGSGDEKDRARGVGLYPPAASAGEAA